MSKKLQLSIPTPCHEIWNNMSAVEKGKFCGSCQKQVVDFTSMNDREIAQFFKKPTQSLSKGGSVCGRFMSDQLDRDIAIPRKRIPWLKYIFQFALPALFFSKASAQEQVGKIAVKRGDSSKVRVADEMRTLGMVLPTCIKPAEEEKKTPLITKGEIKPITIKTSINGKVVDENGEAISYATIETGYKAGVVIADEEGFFSLPLSSLTKKNLIEVSSAGYEKVKIEVDKDDASGSELILNLKSNVILPEVVLSYYDGIGCRKLTGMTNMIMGSVTIGRKIIDTDDSKLLDRQNETNKLIYPNPVKAGSNININFNGIEKAVFSVQLLNLSGQLIKHHELNFNTDERTMNFNIPIVAASNYFMVLTNKKSGKKFTEKLIIQ